MFNEIWRESFLAKKVRRFWSLAGGFCAMIIMAGLLAFVPVVRASAVPPPPVPWPRIESPLDRPVLMVAPRMVPRINRIPRGKPAPVVTAPVYRPRKL